MSPSQVSFALLFALGCCAATRADAQAKASSVQDDDDLIALAGSLGPLGIVPEQRGLNLSIISSSQHDSANGWSQVFTPSLAYRFNGHFSADVATPIFTYLLTDRVRTVKGKAVTSRVVRRDVVSDTVLALHWTSSPLHESRLGTLIDAPTFALVAPTGSVQDGIGTGRVGYNFTNHVESALALNPYVDLGVGTTSRVENRRVQKTQTAAGVSANFAGGLSIPLRSNLALSIESYEQLPIGDQTIYQTVTDRKGRKAKKAIGKGLAEDNGFNCSMDIPVEAHTSLSSFYSRSLRQHEDTVGFSLTYSLRGRPTGRAALSGAGSPSTWPSGHSPAPGPD